jgi:hypothetical protein
MFEGYNRLIAGTLLCQKLLVRHLEEQGALPMDSFREVLEKHLASLSPARRDDITFEPAKILLKALSRPDVGVLGRPDASIEA